MASSNSTSHCPNLVPFHEHHTPLTYSYDRFSNIRVTRERLQRLSPMEAIDVRPLSPPNRSTSTPPWSSSSLMVTNAPSLPSQVDTIWFPFLEINIFLVYWCARSGYECVYRHRGRHCPRRHPHHCCHWSALLSSSSPIVDPFVICCILSRFCRSLVATEAVPLPRQGLRADDHAFLGLLEFYLRVS